MTVVPADTHPAVRPPGVVRRRKATQGMPILLLGVRLALCLPPVSRAGLRDGPV